jgi:uncharacterized protein (TIGR02246 family)
MRRAFSLLLAFILAGCISVSDTQGSSSAPNTAGITSATLAWADAYNSRDAARIAAMYAPDAVFWGTTSAAIRTTPAAIFDYFKDAAKRPDARVSITDQHVVMAGDMGLSAGSYVFTDIRDGKRTENPARFTLVFRRNGSRWELVHHHSSRVPTS